MYAPVLARFTALDPLPPDGEPVLLGASRYAYVNNNPANWVDPSGLEIAGPGYNPYGPGPQPTPPLPNPGPGKCRVELECIKLVGVGWLGTAEHCGLKLTSSSGTVTRQHVRDGKCKFVETQGDLGWLSGTYFVRDTFTVPKAVCDCMNANATRFNAAGLSYSVAPLNSECGDENHKCNSNYAAKCMLQHCGLSSGLDDSPIPPAGWNYRNQQCTSVKYIQSKTGCCSCLAWKTVDGDWCSKRSIGETTANPTG